MVCADFCNHFVLSPQRPDWHMRVDMDKERAATIRKRILDKIASEHISFTGHHMPFPAVGLVEKEGEGHRHAPASHQLDP